MYRGSEENGVAVGVGAGVRAIAALDSVVMAANASSAWAGRLPVIDVLLMLQEINETGILLRSRSRQVDGPEDGHPAHPFRALFTAVMISLTVTSPLWSVSPAAQTAGSVFPNATFTMVMSSLTVTSPPALQSPGQSVS